MSPEVTPSLSVVMPCFNEVVTIKEMVSRVLESPHTAELIVVDDGSTDGTTDVLRSLDDPRVRVFIQPVNMGKGAALRRGFAQATAPYVIVQDADLEYDPADYGVMLEPLLNQRADVVYGSRFHSNRPHRVLYYWHSVGNRVLTTASNMFTNLNLTDVETCYKAFRREVLESFEIEEDRFGFEPEITAKLAQAGWRMYEVGISYDGRSYAQGKKIGWKDGLRAMYCIVRYSSAGRRLADRATSTKRPSDFEAADSELAATLHSLDGATNYADWLVSLVGPHVGGDILEVGAGHGTFSERLARLGRVTASEPSHRAAAVLRERFAGNLAITVLEADAEQAAAQGPFDAVVIINVLEHIDDHVGALAALRSGLRPGGSIAVLVPAFDLLYSEFDRRVGHQRRYRLSTLAAALGEAGFEVVDSRYVNALGAVLWLVYARALRQVPTRSWSVRLYDRLAIPRIRAWEARHRPRFGQSLVCIGRRPLEDD